MLSGLLWVVRMWVQAVIESKEMVNDLQITSTEKGELTVWGNDGEKDEVSSLKRKYLNRS